MRLGYAVKLAQMTFCLTPKVLNAIYVIVLLLKMCAVINPQVIKLTHIQNIIAAVTIRISNAVRLDFSVDNRQ